MSRNHSKGIDAFFNPNSVAVFGSLRDVRGTAYWVIRNMRHFRFRGNIYPVNPNPSKYPDVFGLQVYPDIDQVPEKVELATLITPPDTMPEMVEKCARRGVKAAIVLSEGFAESGQDGRKIQQELTNIAARHGIRIMGPNTFGVVNSANGLVTVPPYTDNDRLTRGGIALCGQTGSLGPHQIPMDDWAYPVSKMCDIGNKCDVDEADIMDYLAYDPDTKVVAMHLEDVRNGAKFMRAARRLTCRKPLVVLKSGRSEAGGRASASHTGSLAGSDRVYDAALKQAGAIRVDTWQELFEVPKTFFYQPLPAGNRFAVITLTGGQGVIAADAASAAGLTVASFSPETMGRMSELFPRLGGNPVDIGPAMSDSRSQAAANPFIVLEDSLSMVLDDSNVDCMTIVFCCGQQLVPLFPMVADMLHKVIAPRKKTVNLWLYGTNVPAMHEFSRQLQSRGLPAYLDLDVAIKSLGYAARYSSYRESLNP